MNRCIVVGTTADGDCWIDQLFRTLTTEWPVVTQQGWELDVIRTAAEQFEEFVFLPQSTEVLDNEVFRLCFEEYAGRSVSLAQHPAVFGMYMGKFRSEIIKAIEMPVIHDKRDAIFWEDRWALPYIAMEPDFVRLGDVPHSDVFEERNGRMNMVASGQYLRRFKGSWMGLSSAACAS